MQDWSLTSVVFPSKLQVIREIAFWNCSKWATPIMLMKSVQLVERQAFEKSRIRNVGFASCNVNITTESVLKIAECVMVPKKCQGRFIQLFGRIVNTQRDGFTGAEQSQSGLASAAGAILFIGTYAFFSWKAWEAIRSRGPDLVTEKVPLLVRPGRD
jgi:hypothetical protein